MNEVWQDNYPWTRFWCPQGGHMAMDGEGYLLDPTRHPERYQLTDVVPFDRIAEKPSLLLLGEPGMGKSSAIKQQATTDKLPGHEHLLIDLRYQRRSDEDVFGTPKFQRWLAGDCSLHLVIDSLDECAEKDFARRFIGKIKDGPIERLKLRIACRKAELPEFLRSELNQAWGKDNVGIYELAPLRKIDVAIASGEHADAFLRIIRERSVAPLANRPITLRFLLKQYWKNRSLPCAQHGVNRCNWHGTFVNDGPTPHSHPETPPWCEQHPRQLALLHKHVGDRVPSLQSKCLFASRASSAASARARAASSAACLRARAASSAAS